MIVSCRKLNQNEMAPNAILGMGGPGLRACIVEFLIKIWEWCGMQIMCGILNQFVPCMMYGIER